MSSYRFHQTGTPMTFGNVKPDPLPIKWVYVSISGKDAGTGTLLFFHWVVKGDKADATL